MTETEKEYLDSKIKIAQDNLNFYKMKKEMLKMTENTPKEESKDPIKDSMDKMFESMFDNFKKMFKPCDEATKQDEEIEESKEDERTTLCCALSTKIKLTIHPFLTDDRELNLGALCNVFASYGVIAGIPNENIKDMFNQELEFTSEDYRKNKEKIEQIKKILKGD